MDKNSQTHGKVCKKCEILSFGPYCDIMQSDSWRKCDMHSFGEIAFHNPPDSSEPEISDRKS